MKTVRQVAETLNVSQRLIYKLVASGELECHRIGSAIRFTEEQISHYLEQSRVVTGPPVALENLQL